MLKEIVVFALPLLLAGLVHHLVVIRFNFLSWLKHPIDFGYRIHGKRLFGNAKTWRGFAVMITATAVFTGILGGYLHLPLPLNGYITGALLGLGYSIGELPNSYLKRQLGISESSLKIISRHPWLSLLDQIDSIIGSLVILWFIYTPTLVLTLWLFVIGSLTHLLIDSWLYFRGYKRRHLQQKV
jgi:hypothetical protein